MRSIRWSLVVYFLVLLAAALGAVSGLVYRTAYQSLEAKEESRRALLRDRHDARCKDLEDAFDNQLLRRARTLAALAQSQWDRRPHAALYSLGVLGAATQPQGYLLMPVWIGEGIDGPLAARMQRGGGGIRIQFAEEVAAHTDEGHPGAYYQVYSERGELLQQSRALDDETMTLAPAVREALGLLEWRYDDTELPPGVALRRVALKTTVSRFRILLGRPSERRGPPPERRSPPPPRQSGATSTGPRFADRSIPAIFIQVAATTTRRDQKLTEYREKLASELAALEAESGATLAALRRRLLWVAGTTFGATMLGGFVLIGMGLAPLRRLSEAVSQVSERDFHLPLEERRLPAELRPIRDRLTQTLEQLRQAFAREKQAAADISHELRTPLAAFLTTIEVALRKPRAPGQYEQVLRECHGIGRQMSVLVERLLVLARLDARVDTPQLQPVNVTELAEQCVALVRPLAQERGLTLHFHSLGAAEVTTDPGKLREVFTNLLHNAIEYNRPGGRVEMAVERTNGALRVNVRDTGIGIAAAAQAHLFERFYRADSSRHADGVHAGLGLAIVQGYVQLLGGTVTVESTEGEGSTFRVQLPAAPIAATLAN